MESHRLLLLLLLLGLAAYTPIAVSEEKLEHHDTRTTTAPLVCPNNFFPVGGRCVLVNPFTEGTWGEAGFYCSTFGSDFLQIETWQFYLDVLNFLRAEGLDKSSYWLGARDEDEEGTWRWEIGGDVLPEGSPYWALDFYTGSRYNIEPMGSNDTNCLRLDHKRYLYLDDDDCQNINSIMCQIVP